MEPARCISPAVSLDLATDREGQNARRMLTRAIRAEAAYLSSLTGSIKRPETTARPEERPTP